VTRVAEAARDFLEPRWNAWRRDTGKAIPACPSTDMCRFSALFLRHVLTDELPEGEWRCVGGSPEADEDVDPDCATPGGYRADDGWRGHYWVSDGDFSFVVDVACDQFGGARVVAKEDDWPGSRYVENYFEGAVHEHMKDVRDRVAAWRGEWLAEHAPGWSAAAAPAP
jgi:hypothetical protein